MQNYNLLLEQAASLGLIESIDLHIANHINTKIALSISSLYSNPHPTIETASPLPILLCHLSLAARQGHLSISLKNQTLTPEITDLWIAPTDVALEWLKKHMNTLSIAILNAWGLLEAAIKYQTSPIFPIVSLLIDSSQHLYFHRFWRAEEELTIELERLLSSAPSTTLSEESYCELLENWTKGNRLTPEQLSATTAVLHSMLTLLSGGPGTGKTHVAAHIVQLIDFAFKNSKITPIQVALIAPTGKAAANLASRIRALLPELSFHCTTIHSLLHSLQKDICATFSYDLVLVDEASMIDTLLMRHLLNKVSPKTRIVLIGDHNQLPSVEPGAPFKEIRAFLRSYPKSYGAYCELRQTLRTDSTSIISAANSIANQDLKSLLSLLEGNQNPSSDFFWEYQALPHNEYEVGKLIDALIDQYGIDIESLQRWKILTPLRKGLWGSEHLNNLIMKKLITKKNHSVDSTLAVPMIITNNDHLLQLYNGEMGILILQSPLKGAQEDDICFFNTSQGTKQYPLALIKSYELAFCLTVHKSQGSEFDEVIALLPEGSELFGWELFYTSVTRSKKKLKIWGSKSTMAKILAKRNTRLGLIPKRLEMTPTIGFGNTEVTSRFGFGQSESSHSATTASRLIVEM